MLVVRLGERRLAQELPQLRKGSHVMRKETIHVGVTTVLCRATFEVREDGTLGVEVQDGVREFALDASEVDRLYYAFKAQRRLADREL